MTEPRNNAYARSLGERLRAVRRQHGLSLHAVERTSRGRWTATLVGAYERGDRMIATARLAELATFYGVPTGALLPGSSPAAPAAGPLVLDLETVRAGHELGYRNGVRLFASRLTALRGDRADRVLTVRGTDLRTLAAMTGLPPGRLVEAMRRDGLLATGERLAELVGPARRAS